MLKLKKKKEEVRDFAESVLNGMPHSSCLVSAKDWHCDMYGYAPVMNMGRQTMGVI
jgi:hypothetical protein